MVKSASTDFLLGDYLYENRGTHTTTIYSPVEKEKEMTNEQIRNEINEATRDFRETTRKVNEALNHAAGRLDKAEKEAYDRGLNDCWEMVRRIYLNSDDPLLDSDLDEIFPELVDPTLVSILLRNTPQEALAKIRAWEEKKAEEERNKQEEAEKIQIGDVVEATVGCPVTSRLKGVFLQETDTSYNVLDSRGDVYICLKENHPLFALNGKSFASIEKATEDGVITAHKKAGVPIIKIEMEELTEESIGEFLYFMMIACAISSYMLGVNPFNQPGVEQYKKETRENLNI